MKDARYNALAVLCRWKQRQKQQPSPPTHRDSPLRSESLRVPPPSPPNACSGQQRPEPAVQPVIYRMAEWLRNNPPKPSKLPPPDYDDPFAMPWSDWLPKTQAGNALRQEHDRGKPGHPGLTREDVARGDGPSQERPFTDHLPDKTEHNAVRDDIVLSPARPLAKGPYAEARTRFLDGNPLLSAATVIVEQGPGYTYLHNTIALLRRRDLPSPLRLRWNHSRGLWCWNHNPSGGPP